MIAGIMLGIVAGLLANELCEFSPWCARKLVRLSAFRRYTDPGRAELRAEELTALINDRPGNLFKLITAVSFVIGAVIVSARRAATKESDADPTSRRALPVTERASWPARAEIPRLSATPAQFMGELLNRRPEATSVLAEAAHWQALAHSSATLSARKFATAQAARLDYEELRYRLDPRRRRPVSFGTGLIVLAILVVSIFLELLPVAIRDFGLDLDWPTIWRPASGDSATGFLTSAFILVLAASAAALISRMESASLLGARRRQQRARDAHEAAVQTERADLEVASVTAQAWLDLVRAQASARLGSEASALDETMALAEALLEDGRSLRNRAEEPATPTQFMAELLNSHPDAASLLAEAKHWQALAHKSATDAARKFAMAQAARLFDEELRLRLESHCRTTSSGAGFVLLVAPHMESASLLVAMWHRHRAQATHKAAVQTEQADLKAASVTAQAWLGLVWTQAIARLGSGTPVLDETMALAENLLKCERPQLLPEHSRDCHAVLTKTKSYER